MSSPAARAIVLGLFDTGLAAVRSLGRAGISPTRDPDALVRMLLDLARRSPRPPVLFPTSDQFVRFASEHRGSFESCIRHALPSQASIAIALDKRRQHLCAREAGVPVVPTYWPFTMDEARGVAERVRYPMVVKPSGGRILDPPFHGAKAVLAATRDQLLGLLDQAIGRGHPVIVQSRIPGPNTSHCKVCAYIGADGSPLACVCMRKIRQYPVDFGVGTLMESVEEPELAELGLRGRLSAAPVPRAHGRGACAPPVPSRSPLARRVPRSPQRARAPAAPWPHLAAVARLAAGCAAVRAVRRGRSRALRGRGRASLAPAAAATPGARRRVAATRARARAQGAAPRAAGSRSGAALSADRRVLDRDPDGQPAVRPVGGEARPALSLSAGRVDHRERARFRAAHVRRLQRPRRLRRRRHLRRQGALAPCAAGRRPPHPPGRGFHWSRMRDALAFADSLHTACVVKPSRNTSSSAGVSVALWTMREVARGFRRAACYSDDILIEEHVTGDDYRVLVFDGECLSVVQRVRPHVVGNARDTVRALIDRENAARISSSDWHLGDPVLMPLKKDRSARRALADQGLALGSVPAAGRRVELSRLANYGIGASYVECIERTHPALLEASTAAAGAAGVVLAGIDIISPDISSTSYVINEINTTPGTYLHYFVDNSADARDPFRAILQRLVHASLPRARRHYASR